jgi:hypothetical protein
MNGPPRNQNTRGNDHEPNRADRLAERHDRSDDNQRAGKMIHVGGQASTKPTIKPAIMWLSMEGACGLSELRSFPSIMILSVRTPWR